MIDALSAAPKPLFFKPRRRKTKNTKRAKRVRSARVLKKCEPYTGPSLVIQYKE